MIRKKISEIRQQFLLEFGIDIPMERIRHYDKLGLIQSRRGYGNHREFTEKDEAETRKALMLIEAGITPRELQMKNTAKIQARIKAMDKLIEELMKEEVVSADNSGKN